MKKYLTPTLLLIAYTMVLIKIMVFKDVPLIKIGSLMLNFGGIDAGHAPNFIPLKTILPYLFGFKGWIIAGINLIGNVALLVPIGFLIPYVYKNVTWRKSLIIAIVSGLIIEIMQVVLRVGIFDIDDVILNALGVMVGYWMFLIFAKMKYGNILLGIIVGIVIVLFVWLPIRFLPAVTHVEHEVIEKKDLCGGTGGNGQIVSVEHSAFTMKRKDGMNQIVNLRDHVVINTSEGKGAEADLNIGDRVTLVGDVNPDGSFSADAVFVCE